MRARGFTLLEVMVAVAILGLSLTVILSAQAGLYASGSYAQHISVADGLARCKMSELEERLLKLGYPAVDEKDDGPCCADEMRQDMRCDWKVELVELPQPQNVDVMGSGDGGIANALGGSSLGLSGSSGSGGSGGVTSGPLAALAQLSTNPQSLSGGDGGMSALASSLAGGGAGAAAGGTSAIAPLVMSFVYPQLKPMLEASIRKVTVHVTWHEGLRSRDVSLIQYVTNPMRANPLGGLGGLDGGVPLPGQTGLPGLPTGITGGR